MFWVFPPFLAVCKTSFLKNQIVVLKLTAAFIFLFLYRFFRSFFFSPSLLPHSFHSLELSHIGPDLPSGF